MGVKQIEKVRRCFAGQENNVCKKMYVWKNLEDLEIYK